jgi:hypothetical protein
LGILCVVHWARRRITSALDNASAACLMKQAQREAKLLWHGWGREANWGDTEFQVIILTRELPILAFRSGTWGREDALVASIVFLFFILGLRMV